MAHRILFPKRLGAELNTVHQKNNLVGILGIGNELSRFETGHGFARAGGMPDKAAATVVTLPIYPGDSIRNGVGRVILVTPHDFQHAVGIIGHSVEADELVAIGIERSEPAICFQSLIGSLLKSAQ